MAKKPDNGRTQENSNIEEQKEKDTNPDNNKEDNKQSENES